MPLIRKGANYAFGSKGVSATGLVSVTGFDAGREFETDVQAKDENGVVASHLYGNEKNNASAEGFVDLAQGDISDMEVPQLEGTITVGDITVPVMRSSIQGSNEDFVKARLEGSGYKDIDYAAGGGGGGGNGNGT
ncbi:MAG: hypothetical protein LBK99_03480 [Opitutaceae bacterium]|jgi:hypothetical protein|nr:hypothetical protein [Opitutaceae bacterium]